MDFVNMRKALNQNPQNKPMPTMQQASQSSVALISNKRQAPPPPPAPVMDDDITYKKIIEDKPPKGDVLEYFRNRIDELKAEKDI